jgi:NAD(P)-dependent dehydrogenase (short-subunit alcohol dehydrogenase family)
MGFAHVVDAQTGIPLILAPEDVAGAAVFLASPAAEYVHGIVLSVDGGWSAN